MEGRGDVERNEGRRVSVLPSATPARCKHAAMDREIGSLGQRCLRSAGSFFGGRPKTTAWWVRYYYAYDDHYLARLIFVGKVHTHVNSPFFLRPSCFISVWYDGPDGPEALFLSLSSSSGKSELILGDCGDQ